MSKCKTINLYGFNSVEPPKLIKDYLETYTGEGTVYALEVSQPKQEGSRTCARVQFTSRREAKIIKDKASDRSLWYNGSYLMAWDLDRDIVQRPKEFLHSLDSVTLHFGCMVSKGKFSSLWKHKDVSAKFGFGLKKFYFFLLSGLTSAYKLELCYENIRQVELFRPLGQAKNYMLLQLLGAPMIFVKDSSSLSYYMEAIDEQWIRDVDFTPSCSIGHSSALCLELPTWCSLPNFEDHLYLYKENSGPFAMEKGVTFSSNPVLVPIVWSLQLSDLPYEVLFKVNSLIQHGCIPGPSVDDSFFGLVHPKRFPINFIEQALEELLHLRECCYDPVTWLKDQYVRYIASGKLPASPLVPLDDGLVYVRRVQVTPTKVYFCGPEANLSNRVLRSYPDDINNFLRVSFVDEDLDQLYSTTLSPRGSSANEGGTSSISQRILSTLRNGIAIGDKKFDFLAFSQSQLRDSSLWMFASRPGLTAADIREWMGDFSDIKNVAKYAARLGQSFSSSRETFHVQRHEIELIPDVKRTSSNGVEYIFSDGIGKISAELAQAIGEKLGFRCYFPSAFQIRYGGYKGVVAVDPTSSKKLSLRESMCKFRSSNTSLDVLGWSKYQPCFLNRELITLLSTLGVEDHVLERKQLDAVSGLDAILTDTQSTQEALGLIASGEYKAVLKEMLRCGYKPNSEPFLSIMLQTFRASKLLDLRTKSRIFIPKGRAMMGCLDETGTLEYGQVFVQCSRARNTQSLDGGVSSTFGSRGSHLQNQIVQGKVVVAKNPCLHPGDMRILEAVDVPALHHMMDCIVFPQLGQRPHPNECSGSDLDGDVYFVCWDPDLIPRSQFAPMDYAAAKSKVAGHDITIEEVQEHFADYILDNNLGIICTAHTVFADREPNMAMSSKCIELAKSASVAVDFPKTGVAAKIPPELRAREYPDFMEKPDRTSYESPRVIGKLYRAIRNVASPIRSFTEEVAARCYDTDMEVSGFEDYISEAIDYKQQYDNMLANLMNYYGIKTESEILSGCILKMSKSFNRKNDLETILLGVRSLRKQAKAWFQGGGRGSEDDGIEDGFRLCQKASAWYHVTYHPKFWGRYSDGLERGHFLSFAWCASDKLIEIKKGKSKHLGEAEQINQVADLAMSLAGEDRPKMKIYEDVRSFLFLLCLVFLGIVILFLSIYMSNYEYVASN